MFLKKLVTSSMPQQSEMMRNYSFCKKIAFIPAIEYLPYKIVTTV